MVLRLVQPEQGCVSHESIVSALTPARASWRSASCSTSAVFAWTLKNWAGFAPPTAVCLFVDAIQGLGAFPLDVNAAQIAGLAADGHKWLLSVEGAGVLYVNRRVMEMITPSEIGWWAVRGWADFTNRELSWRSDARRYECGSLNTVGIYGLRAAVRSAAGSRDLEYC